MNKTEFISLVEHPEHAGNISLAETEKVISEFPYWQSMRLLYVKALHEKQHFSYQSKLKLAAIYAGDRSKLFELINKNSDNGKTTTAEPVIEENNVPANSVEILEEENISTEDTTVDNPLIATENITDDVAVTVERALINQQSLETEIESNNTLIETPVEENESANDFSNEELIEGDLNSIIEKRIKELTEQNNSYATLEQDKTEPNIPSEKSSLTDVEVDQKESPKTELSYQTINEDEKISVEEELAAFDVYEETAIATDLLKMQPAQVSSSEVEVFQNTDLTADEKSTPHSFLEWLTVLKTRESGSNNDLTQEGHLEPSRVSAEVVEEISDALEAVANERTEIEDHVVRNTPAEESLDSTEKNETLSTKPETTNLIDKFIEAEPRIQPRKSAFFSPSTAARKSVMYDEDVVSETLAEIFYGQHLYDKAIKAYEKLTLMFPEKSTLFAARIQKIKEESQSGK